MRMMMMKSFVSWAFCCLFLSFASTMAFVPSTPTTLPALRPATPSLQRHLASAAASTTTVLASFSTHTTAATTTSRNNNNVDEERQAWIDRSVQYYSKVMREERRRSLGQIPSNAENNNDDFVILAKKHYFALRKIKDGKPAQAESIYRRILGELLHEEQCDHAKLAVTTLLLALLLQGRSRANPKAVRAVFLHFFRIVCDSDEECACSAKVLQAFALFEMKQGNPLKSLYIVRRALRLDPTLQPVLQWKQFREAVRRDAALQRRQNQAPQARLAA